MEAAGVHPNEAADRRNPNSPRPASRPDRVALIVDRDCVARRSLSTLLDAPGMHIIESSDADEALSVLRREKVDLVVTDQELVNGSGIELLESARALQADAARVLIASEVDMSAMCDAINRAGISHLLRKPLDAKAIACLHGDLLGSPPPAARIRRPGDDASPGARFGIIGNSPAIRSLIDLIEKVGPTDSTVLISGETGTGKELVGRAIHDVSLRKDRTFSAINSAALPENLLESELFGHRRGAFTGAASNRQGLFEHTHMGTVFLDELGEMPLSMQAKLLRFLQTGEVRPVGGETARCVDVRLVSATNRDLEKEVMAGRFREDLYYRLAVIPITVPPLRERIEDIPLLARDFLDRRASEGSAAPIEIDADAMDALVKHSWPGNVRELQNVIERGLALCDGSRIRLDDLPHRFHAAPAPEPQEAIQSLPKLERKHILETLDTVGWNRKRAASLLQISTTTLWRRLKEFGIDEAEHRARNQRHRASSL